MIDPKALGDEIDAGRGRQAFSPEERRLLMVALHAYASRPEANYEPPTGWELRCEKCGRQQGMACGWPSNCPTGQGSREYVKEGGSNG